MNLENLSLKEEFVSTLILPTVTGNDPIVNGNQITYSWYVNWASVFKHYPHSLPLEGVFQVTHEFYGDHLSGPLLNVGYTADQLLTDPQTTNFLLSCSFAESGGVGIGKSGNSTQNLINTVSWDTPIGAVDLSGQVGFFAVRAATKSYFIARNPERTTQVSITFTPNNSAYDPTYIVSDTQGVHQFHFKLLK